MKSFGDKVVVITGAGSGIGRALAEAFAQEGARLALNDVDQDSLEETLRLPVFSGWGEDRVMIRCFDVSDREAQVRFAGDVVQRFGSVDVLINNAGIGHVSPSFDKLELAHLERVMAINYFGVVYGSHAFVPHLLRRPESVLVNVYSVFGLTGIVGESAYCSAKFGVYGFSQALREEYRDSPLQVISVHPGGIKTNIVRKAINYEPRHDLFAEQHFRHTPEYAAKIILRGIRRRKARILIGGEAYLIDRLVRLFPVWGVALINRTLDRTRQEIEKPSLKS